MKLKQGRSLRFAYQQRKRFGHIPRFFTRQIPNLMSQSDLLKSPPLRQLCDELNTVTLLRKLMRLSH